MKKIASFLTLFVLSFYLSGLRAGVITCSTTGGYDPGKLCVSSCYDITVKAPFQSLTSPPADPSDLTDKGMWCATVKGYSTTVKTIRKNWGYCDCVTESPTAWEPTPEYYADGGGVSTATKCVLGGLVRFDDKEYTFSSSGCENITDGKPFTNFDLKLPKDPNTDTAKWCPVTDPYNAKSIASPATKKQNWGYCLTKSPTRQPTHWPTNFPTTQEPTSSPTDSPTAFLPTKIYRADGAGVGFNNPAAVDSEGFQQCVLPFTYKAKDGKKTVFKTCASFNDFTPFIAFLPPPPKDERTNTSLWCAINSNLYEPYPSASKYNRKNWGYCLITETTRSPTTPFPSNSPTTLSPTYSPTTISPIWSPTTVSPTKATTLSPTQNPNNSPTDAPTVATEAPSAVTDSSEPTSTPSMIPSTKTPLSQPTGIPTSLPTAKPSTEPTVDDLKVTDAPSSASKTEFGLNMVAILLAILLFNCNL